MDELLSTTSTRNVWNICGSSLVRPSVPESAAIPAETGTNVIHHDSYFFYVFKLTRRLFYRSIITILFPAFASYKAIRSGNPAQLTPWLMYWVVLSGILLAESWTVFIIGWYVTHFLF